MEHIYLGISNNYKELANEIKLDKNVNQLKGLIEIDIPVYEDKQQTKLLICSQLTNFIINKVKNKVLKEIVNTSYRNTYLSEVDSIYKCSLGLFNNKEQEIKRILFNRMYTYLSDNDYLNINGFIKFRLRDFMDYILELKDRGFEEYLIEKDYNEFIKLLKYFVDVQEEKIEILNLYIEKDGTFKLYDKDNKDLEETYAEDMFDIALRENMNEEDFLISALITLCPKQIYIQDNLESNLSKEIIQTIKAIFEGRVTVGYRA
ncbi:MAG: putative sporulation protein YtxC [Tepidibacter sp.]|jgi:putative sporulation protein YtxC|uniref:putative sporulation protein YtxC n=1 Tax=Tepidibacter sp. TaxID=2529387 RepID=UPI0025F63997|nr:putative sporulation protein YtxC [Tepidibacter sp.]MCT4508779.1 putative sporulation protein YtxC [Tepidibacter sp.]